MNGTKRQKKPTRVGVREFARQTGRSPAAVTKAIQTGRLKTSVVQGARGPSIDPEAGLREWAENTRDRVDAAAEGSTHEAWKAARARREAALAALAEDELRQRRGELLEAAGVEAALVGEIARAKGKLMGIPSRLRQQCPHLALGDLAELERLIREALEDLAASAARKEAANAG